MPEVAPIALPGGGSFVPPKHYDAIENRSFGQRTVALFRKLKPSITGSLECEGLIVVCRREHYPDLDAFSSAVEDIATTKWTAGSLKPGWVSFESERFPVTYADGPSGRERMQELLVRTVGFLDNSLRQAWQVTFDHSSDLLIKVWLYEKHGGLEQARALADGIAASLAA